MSDHTLRAAAVGFSRYGGPEVLTMVEVELPPPGPGQVLVRTRATPVNPADIWLAEASTLPMSALTALNALDTLDLAPGSTLLVTGAAGAVGGYAVQLARGRGLRVVASAGERDWPQLEDFGADVCITRDDVTTAALREAPEGVDGVVDGAVLGSSPHGSSAHGSSLLGAIRPGGRLAVLRPMPEEGLALAARAGVDVRLISVRAYQGNPERLAGLVRKAAAGALTLRVADTMPPWSSAYAHRRLELGGVRGRLVLEW